VLSMTAILQKARRKNKTQKQRYFSF